VSFGRSRFWPLRNANIPSGLGVPFWLLSVPSRMLGALNKSMTKVAPGLFIAVSVTGFAVGFSDWAVIFCRMFLIEFLASVE